MKMMNIWILVSITLQFEQYCILYTDVVLCIMTDLYAVDVCWRIS